MMSQALTAAAPAAAGSFSLPPTLQSREVNYFSLMEKYKLQERTLHRLEELKSGNTLSDLSSSSASASAAAATSSFSRGGVGGERGGGGGGGGGRSKATSRSVTISFREIVEEFAMRNEVEFLQKINPKTGEAMLTEEGKMLWEFNRVVCYIDNNVLYVKKRMTTTTTGTGAGAAGTGGGGGNHWYPISFDDLLTLSRTMK
jgi:hypothetical protein